MEYTRYARVSHSRQWRYYNVVQLHVTSLSVVCMWSVACWPLRWPHVTSR